MKKALAVILGLIVLSSLVLAQSESIGASVIHVVIIDIHNDSMLHGWYNESYTGPLNFSEYKAWTLKAELEAKSKG